MFTTTLRQGMSGRSVMALQLELKRLGLYQARVDGSFGPVTRRAVDAFERTHRLPHDGIADARTRNAVHAAAVARPSPTAPTPAPGWKTVAAPRSDYRRVNYAGGRMNVRTREMFQRAERYLRAMGVTAKMHVVQGSYHPGYGPSAGTHDGGGVLDVHTRSFSAATADKFVKALRMAGFAAWRRGVNDTLPPHIHMVAIGDRQMSPSARNQVREYFAGGDGLRGNRADVHGTARGHNVGRPIPNWARR